MRTHATHGAVGVHRRAGPTNGDTELARAFDGARFDTDCLESLAVANSSTYGCAELADAVRAFVAAERADGSPPERVLASIKSVTRRYFIDGIDEAHGDRLQALILREFLASYYGVAATQPAARHAE